MTMTTHAQERLADRSIEADWVLETVEMGTRRRGARGCVQAALDGLIVIFNPYRKVVVTAYWGTYDQLQQFA